ncbi:MAG: hypothetical protein K0R28_1974, partial [Paenibacillus sp.]|nr:hypothetical protein [Paenibacillus sp.]
MKCFFASKNRRLAYMNDMSVYREAFMEELAD